MADDFNPYHVWLGIPLKDQPANYYRLLSLDIFETSGDVIDSAADRQMAHLRTFQSGKHGELTQRLLNEVAAARVCLLDPKKRAAYDQQLRAKLPPATPAAPSAASGSAIQRQPPRRPGPLPTVAPAPAPRVPAAAASPQPGNNWDDLLGDPAARPANRSAGKSGGANATKASAAKRAAGNRNMSIGIGAAVLLIAAAGIGWFAFNGSSSDGTLEFDWPSDERADASVTVDDVPLPAPASGAWEYHGPAGSHHVVALRPAYKIDANVALAAGQRQTAPADWKPKSVLVLNWPLSARAGAELKIDGRTHAVAQHDPLELAVEPGPHVVQITRSDSAPIVRSATLAPEGRALVAIAAPPPTTAKLVFDWPTDQRKDAELIIDGSKQTVASGSDSASFALVVSPGRHVVHITRAGFEPFNQTIELAAGENQSLTPIWTREQNAAPTVVVETSHPVEAPTQPAEPVKKLPAPAATEQERIAKQLDEIYKTSRAGFGGKDPAVARKLYEEAGNAGDSPAERYMLLMKGAEIAAAAGDLNLSLQGIDTLDADYEIDALEAKQKLLDRYVTAGKSDQVAAAIPTAEQLIDQAIAADRYEIALIFAATASRAVTKSKIATRKEIEDRLSRRRHDIRLIEPIFALVKSAQESLAKNPADPEANSNLGRWRCLYKGDWAGGLPLLAKGNDEKLTALAEQELKAPTDADEQVKLAETWWDLAQKEAGIARDSVRLHAGDIYQAALPNVSSALKKAAIEKRLAEIADLKPIVAMVANGAIGPGKSPGAIEFPLNQWVDVLRLVDTTRDRVDGTWARKGTELSCTPGFASRIELPVVVEGGYDLDVEFTRTSSDEPVAALLSVGSNKCMIMLSGWKGGDSGLMDLDGRDAGDRRNPIAVRPAPLENGHRYRVLVGVRLLADNRARIDVSLDGKPYLPRWEGDPATLSENRLWLMRKPRRLGFGAYQCDVTFHSVRLRMVSGQASVAESAPPQLAPATAGSDKPSSVVAFPPGQVVDLLKLVDPTRDAVKGNWSRSGSELSCEPVHLARISLPVVIDGAYDLEVEFTRTDGTDSVDTVIPIASHQCCVKLSGWHGKVSGLDSVDGQRADQAGNPTVVRPGMLENGHRYRLLVRVRLPSPDQASIDVLLDGKRCLPHWQGAITSLGLERSMALPNPHQPALGANSIGITYHAVRLRMVSGQGSGDASVAGSAFPSPAPAVADKATGPVKFPLDQSVDVLRLVDTTRNVVAGRWSRSGEQITVEASETPRIAIPVAVDGGYDLELEFTRTSGKGDVAAMVSILSHPCMVTISAADGAMSGFQNVDGREVFNAENPIVVKPGYLENGRRYRLLVKARIISADLASVDVWLDGKPYLPHWEANPASLSASKYWPMPKEDGFGLGAQKSDVTFHTARLRMVSGRAWADATPKSPSESVGSGSPLRFTKWTYPADERGRPGYFEQRGAEWVEAKQGKVVAHFKESARTADYVELFDQGRRLWVRLKPTECAFSRNQTNWVFIAKGTPSANP
jgi:hypothetical protein